MKKTIYKTLIFCIAIAVFSIFINSCDRFGNKQEAVNKNDTTRIVCASKQLRSFTNGTADGLFRSSHKRSRRLHARRGCNVRRLQSQGASNLRRLHEGSEDCRLFARSTFTNVVRFRRDIAALRHDCESGQS